MGLREGDRVGSLCGMLTAAAVGGGQAGEDTGGHHITEKSALEGGGATCSRACNILWTPRLLRRMDHGQWSGTGKDGQVTFRLDAHFGLQFPQVPALGPLTMEPLVLGLGPHTGCVITLPRLSSIPSSKTRPHLPVFSLLRKARGRLAERSTAAPITQVQTSSSFLSQGWENCPVIPLLLECSSISITSMVGVKAEVLASGGSGADFPGWAPTVPDSGTHFWGTWMRVSGPKGACS